MATVDTGLAESLEQGFTLPASWYSDPGILALEREHIFARNWQYVGRAEQVAEHGAFFTARCGHVPIVVVRDGDTVRAFVNVCRHRGHLVAQGTGQRSSLQCPYHAWTYGLDGCLRAAPRSKREPGFDLTSFPLLPVAVDTFGPMVFANPDAGAAPLAEALGSLPERLAAGGLDLDALRFRERVEWQSPVNWKTGLENYLECYHCAVAHPGFSRLIDVDPDAYALEADGLLLTQSGRLRASADNGKGEPAPYVPDGPVEQAQYHLLWPNSTFNVELGPGNLAVDATYPLDAHRTQVITDHFFAEGVPEAEAAEMMAFGAQVGAEDEALVASVQEGLDSGMVPQGRLLGESEQLLAHFQRRIHQALGAA